MPFGDARWRQMPTSQERSALARFREQQAATAAKRAMANTPAFAAYSLSEVTAAMVQAKAAVLASGIRLDSDGSRQLIEAQALKLLQG
jgi:hypothetical protein